MRHENTRLSVQVNARNNVNVAHSTACYTNLMQEEWFLRLETLIAEDGRSYRKLSEDAGCGANFVQQLLKNRKDPRASQLSKLLKALGPSAASYVITGFKLNDSDVHFLETINSLDHSGKEAALLVLQRMQSQVSSQEQSPETAEAAPSK